MISSFWNFCRVCPSIPDFPLHTEYRSTFQWHEYVGSSDSSVTQPPVIRQPASQSRSDQLSTLPGRPGEPSFPRRKKHPDLANRSSDWLSKSSTAYEANDSRSTNFSGAKGPRKSLSMGTIRPAGVPNLAPIHSQKQSLIPQENKSAVAIDESSASRGVPMATSVPVTIGLSGFGGEGLSDFLPSQSSATDVKIEIGKESSRDPAPNFEDFRRKEYKSEYKKRFRPFSQYEYVDGRFFKKKGDQDENPWYKEVIELRKKAGEYKFRGWGTELGPQNIAQVYHQHVWDQVSRRTSLAALALMSTTTPKSISKEEKDKENSRKSYPGKPMQHARPHTATPKHPISDLHLKESSDTVQSTKKKLPGEENRIQNKSTSRVKELSKKTRPPSHKPTISTLETKLLKREARSHSAGPAGRSPRKTIRQQSAASSISEKDNSGTGGWKIHLDSSQVDGPKTQQKHPRPTTLATTSRPKTSSGKGDPGELASKQQQSDKSSADPYMRYTEPIMKSPPEPTRVKSPEQVLRSPEINWTVPLDTTRSFTVTQNIRDAPLPPSPRFRGEKLHGDIRNIHHPTSTHHSSAASTLASSPISTFSTRSAPSTAPGTIPPSKSSTTTTSSTTVPSKVAQTTASTDKVIPHPVTSSNVGESGGDGKKSGAGAGVTAGDGSGSTRVKQTPSSKLEQNSHHQKINGFEDTRPATALPKTLQKEKVGLGSSSTTTKSSPHHQQPRMGVAAASRPNKDLVKPSSTTTTTTTTSSTTATPPIDKRPPSQPPSSTFATVNMSLYEKGKQQPKQSGGPALKCVEDPTFMFDSPKTFSTVKSSESSKPGSKLPEPLKPIPSKLPEPPVPKSMTMSMSSKLPEPHKSFPSTLTSKTQPEVSKSIPPVMSKLSESKPPSAPSTTTSSKIPEPSKSTPGGSRKSTEPALPSSTTSSYSTSGISSSGIKGPTGTSQPKSSFRVLEAPVSPPSQGIFNIESKPFVPPAPVSAPKKTIGGVSQVSEIPPPLPHPSKGYRVLEAPDDSDEPTVSVVSPNSGRSRASDVLEKARHRFDKFWGKSKDEEK